MEIDMDDEEDNPAAEGEQTPMQQAEPEPIQEEVLPDGPPIAEIPNQPPPPVPGVHPGSVAAAKQRAAQDVERTRSPTPPRALYRSTTGKGVAFTDEDVTFLVRFLEYRTRQQDGKVDMVVFWKDVANKVHLPRVRAERGLIAICRPRTTRVLRGSFPGPDSAHGLQQPTSSHSASSAV